MFKKKKAMSFQSNKSAFNIISYFLLSQFHIHLTNSVLIILLSSITNNFPYAALLKLR